MNLFIASYRFKKPIAELYQATIPFMFVLLFALAVITYVPEVFFSIDDGLEKQLGQFYPRKPAEYVGSGDFESSSML